MLVPCDPSYVIPDNIIIHLTFVLIKCPKGIFEVVLCTSAVSWFWKKKNFSELMINVDKVVHVLFKYSARIAINYSWTFFCANCLMFTYIGKKSFESTKMGSFSNYDFLPTSILSNTIYCIFPTHWYWKYHFCNLHFLSSLC